MVYFLLAYICHNQSRIRLNVFLLRHYLIISIGADFMGRSSSPPPKSCGGNAPHGRLISVEFFATVEWSELFLHLSASGSTLVQVS